MAAATPPRRHSFRPGVMAAVTGAMVAATLLAVTGVTAHAYNAVGDTAQASASCTTAASGQLCAVSATVTDPNGQGVAGLTVVWTVSGCGSVNPTTTVTGPGGTTSTTFTAGAGCCSSATITATAPSVGVVGTTQVGVNCVVKASRPLPPTSGGVALPPAGSPAWARLTLLGGVAMLLAGALVLRMTRRRTAAPHTAPWW